METLMNDNDTDINVELGFINATKLIIKNWKLFFLVILVFLVLGWAWVLFQEKYHVAYKIDSIVKSETFFIDNKNWRKFIKISPTVLKYTRVERKDQKITISQNRSGFSVLSRDENLLAQNIDDLLIKINEEATAIAYRTITLELETINNVIASDPVSATQAFGSKVKAINRIKDLEKINKPVRFLKSDIYKTSDPALFIMLCSGFLGVIFSSAVTLLRHKFRKTGV